MHILTGDDARQRLCESTKMAISSQALLQTACSWCSNSRQHAGITLRCAPLFHPGRAMAADVSFRTVRFWVVSVLLLQETQERFPKLGQMEPWEELGSGEAEESSGTDCDDEDGCQASGDGQSQNCEWHKICSHTHSFTAPSFSLCLQAVVRFTVFTFCLCT